MSERRKMSLATKVLLGMLLGALFGVFMSNFFPGSEVNTFLGMSLFHLGGSLFLNMFRMIVIPVVLVSMIRGVTTMNNPALLGRVGLKTLVIFTVTTVLSSIFGIFASLMMKLGQGTSIQLPARQESTVVQTSFLDTIREIVPRNPFAALGEGNMLQVIFIAVIIGLAITLLANKTSTIQKILEELDAINIKIVELTLSVAPLGVFCLMTETFGSFGVKAMVPLMSYVVCIVSVMAVVTYVMYPLMLCLMARVSPVRFYKKFSPVMLFAFSSSSSNATLPMNIRVTTERIGVDKSLATFILSLGATINMNGTAVMQGTAAIFLANLYGIDLSMGQLCQIVVVCLISSIGTAGMPGAGVLMLGLVLQSVGIPVEGTAIILGIDRIVDMFRTTVNITGDAVTAVIVSSSEKQFDRDVYLDNIPHERH